MPPTLSRRNFMTATTAAATLALTSRPASAAEKKAAPRPVPLPKKHYKIIAFSKPFANYTPEQTADLVAEVGWDGIECPVRAKATHIDPEKVEEGLPPMVEALRRRGKEVTIVTTDITQLTPAGEKILRTMAKLGIKQYRLGFEKYPRHENPAKKVTEVGAALKDLAAFNRELGLQAGWQNHSGADYVGAPVWDLWTMMQNLDPRDMGVCFDIAHATIEGGLSWPIQTRLVQDRMVAVFCKDAYWEKGAKGWAPRWCEFGAGCVQPAFFDWLRTTDFSGPLSQHHEYKELGTGPVMVAHFKQDLAALRAMLA